MLYKIMMKKTTILISAVLLAMASLSLVSAIGVTYPHPQDIELLPGEETSFVFQIQAHDFDVKCVPVIEETQGLEITLNKEYIVQINERLNVKGKVKLPADMSSGDYKATFCIECSPLQASSGSSVKQRTCNLPVTVKGVSERTRQNSFDIEQGERTLLWTILILVVLILLVILSIWYVLKKRK